MLNISFSQPVAWASSPPPEVPQVAPVGAVTPVSGRPREGQSNLGARGDAQPQTTPESHSMGEKSGAELQAAPLLPNKRVQDGQRSAGSPVEPDAALQQEREAEEKAAQKPPPLQEVLSSVWKASAAVVDVVLGRELAANAADKTEGVAPAAMPQPGLPSAQKERLADADFSTGREQGDPVAYTEQGTSAWAALETGSLVNRKA